VLLIIFFIIATANFCLGYALVVCLGQPSSLRFVWQLSSLPQSLRRASRTHTAPSDMKSEAPLKVIAQSTPTSSPPPAASATRAKSELEQSIELARAQLAGYRRSLVTIDSRLRAAAVAEQQPVSELLGELKMLEADYAARQRTVTDALRGHGFGALAPIRANVESALARHAERMQTAGVDFERLDGQADVSDCRRELLGGLIALLDGVHELRDRLSLSLIEIARQERRLGSLEPELLSDLVTELPSRAKLEAQLDDWWQLDPERTRKLSVAALDIDNFRQLNEEHGATVADAVLRSIAEVLAEANAERRGNLAGLFGGQKYALLLGNTGARNATGTVERVRQAVQLMSFRHNEHEIRVTLSCSVVEAQAGDTSDTLFQRVEATLQEAKRYGRNRTFLHEGDYPTPVMPLNFALEERSVSV
jgi:diguanylate cyclase